MEIFQFFGRLHPIVLHMPIGFLVLASLMEWGSRYPKFQALEPAVGFAIQLGMWSAIFAAGSGYVLSLEGGYDDTLLGQHQWLGILTAFVSIIIYFLHQKKKSKAGRKFFFPVFVILMLLLGFTGHLGGSLTHGSDFLTAPFYSDTSDGKNEIVNLDSALVYQDIIQPIFKEKCISCHNPSKVKGKLLMTTVGGIQKGGETGTFYVAGNADASLFFQRINLPETEKEHMPPKGKKQLSKNEITLLKWWVNEGASFDKKINEVERSENIQAILKKYVQPDESVFSLKVDPASPKKIQALKNIGVQLSQASEDSPFLFASLKGMENIDKDILKKLSNISEQLVELDLGNTNLDDEMFSVLGAFPHLQKLFLQKTKITGREFDVLEKMKYLEYLNLYETSIEDQALVSISKIKKLKRLFLWKTNISEKAINQLKNENPRLEIDAGISQDVFGRSTIKPPLIITSKDIFPDTLRVAFQTNFKKADLFYTIDGSVPDSTSLKYENPFVISETADIQVVAKREGWEDSPPIRKLLVRTKYQAKKVIVNKSPNEKYKAEGATSFADLKKGTINFSEGNWLGYEGEHFTVTLDFGKTVEMSRVTLSALEDTNSWIFFPKDANVLLSSNGSNYKKVAGQNFPKSQGPEPSTTKNFALNFQKQKARFVKVEVKSHLKNPDWHPGAGMKCWVFVDEILVE